MFPAERILRRSEEVGCSENSGLASRTAFRAAVPGTSRTAAIAIGRALGTAMLALQRTAFRASALMWLMLLVLRRPRRVGVLVPLRLAFGTAPLPSLPLALLNLAFRGAIGLPVPGGRANLEFVQLVPFLVSPIPVRNGKQFTNPTTHLVWLHIIHRVIMNHTSIAVQPDPDGITPIIASF